MIVLFLVKSEIKFTLCHVNMYNIHPPPWREGNHVIVLIKEGVTRIVEIPPKSQMLGKQRNRLDA